MTDVWLGDDGCFRFNMDCDVVRDALVDIWQHGAEEGWTDEEIDRCVQRFLSGVYRRGLH